MIQDFEVRLALEHYQEYVDSLKDAQDDIEAFEAHIYHVGGSYAKRPENPIDRGSIQIINMEWMRQLVSERDRFQHSVKLAEDFITWLSDLPDRRDKSFIIDRYRNQRSIAWMECEYSIDRSTVFRKIDYLIRKYIKCLKHATSRADLRDNIIL